MSLRLLLCGLGKPSKCSCESHGAKVIIWTFRRLHTVAKLSFKTLVSFPLSGLSKQPRSLTVSCTRPYAVFRRLRKPHGVIVAASLGVMCPKCYRTCIPVTRKGGAAATLACQPGRCRFCYLCLEAVPTGWQSVDGVRCCPSPPKTATLLLPCTPRTHHTRSLVPHQEYGPTMQRAVVDLPELDGPTLCAKLRITKVTSPGMDRWGIDDLKLLATWSPVLFEQLARLLHTVEERGCWPEPLVQGAVCCVPKDVDRAVPTAMQHRHSTILSSVYRLWAAVRHDQLAVSWQPKWIHRGAYGLKGRPAADALVFDTCAYLAGASQANQFVAGISYDFEKCFDRVPFAFAVNVLRARGCDNKICRALDAFYSHHVKHFRIDGHYDSPLRPFNGLVQGCPLSMLVLSSMISCWHEHLEASRADAESKSYADDISVFATGSRPQVVHTKVVAAHSATTRFASLSRLKVNSDKSFSFGHKSLQGCVPGIAGRRASFRLTGGTVKLSPCPSWTQLEQQKASKWSDSVANVRRLPVGWFTKVQWLQQVSSQLTWAQSSHRLALSRDVARSLRSKVVRALLDTDHYSASPYVVFALLAPPSLEPECAMQLSALRLFMHSVSTPDRAREASVQLASAQPFDGPYARAQQLRDSAVFGPVVQDVVQGRALSPRWQHDLRERWRKQCWQLVLRDRSEDYAGVGRGVNRLLTISLVQQWTKQADDLQFLLDQGLAALPDASHDPRPRLKILRLLLTGGLMDPERDRRHMRKAERVKCQCGGTPSHDHISWVVPVSLICVLLLLQFCRVLFADFLYALSEPPWFLPLCPSLSRLCTRYRPPWSTYVNGISVSDTLPKTL